jgi:hypothetical protein
MIKAIETQYKGYRFRSRLEARWAVFFDAVGIEWEYEPEGYNINGIMYLPDFYLPRIKTYAEVKPAGLSEDEIDKVNALALESGCRVILLVGIPDKETTYLVAEPHSTIKEFGTLENLKEIMADPDNYIITNDDKTLCLFYSECGYSLLLVASAKRSERNLSFTDAFIKAKSARFEHGETP